jgi:tetratricopeptide (TPR) repeat protein
MNLSGKLPTFRQKRPISNPYRVLLWLTFLLAGMFVLRGWAQGDIRPLNAPTPTPTRSANSFALEGETHFIAGDLNSAISAYQSAVKQDPQNGELLSELARIQTYSSNLLTTDDERKTRLQEALDSANQAVKVAPDSSTAHAVRSFVLDWNSNTVLAGDQSSALLTEAEQEAVRALQLDAQNTLALAYYAEILTDEQKWLQAEQYINQALARDPSLMDVHRVNAYVRESLGYYSDAINEYLKAAEISPNLTFLYISIGANYRQLRVYDKALEYFAKAATINEQLSVKDPIPYLSISKTYSQMGEFFIAARNVKKALSFNPNSPDVYGQLGIIYFKSRNYEGSIPTLKCAIYGCDAATSCDVRECDPKTDPAITITGMPLTANTVVYYYTYGSVLAAMHRASDTYCNDAVKVLEQVRAGFPKDETIMSIVQNSEDICASYGIVP